MTAIHAAIVKKHGEELISDFRGGRKEVPVFPFNIPVMDSATMVGGVPQGRVVEIFGPQHVGKTSLAMHLATSVQRMGLPVIWLDYECAFDVNYAQVFGLSFDENLMTFSQPESLEEGFDLVEVALSNGFPGLIVLDSIPAAKPAAILESKIEADKRPGFEALRLTRCIERVLRPLRESNAVFVGLNQRRAVIGARQGKFVPADEKFDTPGGLAWKHYCSMRFQLTLAHGEGWETREKRSEIRVRIIKNKVGMPYQEALLHLVPGVGFIA